MFCNPCNTFWQHMMDRFKGLNQGQTPGKDMKISTLVSLIKVQQILLIFWKIPTCMLLLRTCTFINFVEKCLPALLLRTWTLKISKDFNPMNSAYCNLTIRQRKIPSIEWFCVWNISWRFGKKDFNPQSEEFRKTL